MTIGSSRRETHTEVALKCQKPIEQPKRNVWIENRGTVDTVGWLIAWKYVRQVHMPTCAQAVTVNVRLLSQQSRSPSKLCTLCELADGVRHSNRDFSCRRQGTIKISSTGECLYRFPINRIVRGLFVPRQFLINMFHWHLTATKSELS